MAYFEVFSMHRQLPKASQADRIQIQTLLSSESKSAATSGLLSQGSLYNILYIHIIGNTALRRFAYDA